MAYAKWYRAESQAAHDMLQDGKTHAEIALRLNEVFENARTRDKVCDAFRKGSIARALNGDLDTVFERSPHMKVIQKGDSTTVDANRPFSDEEMAEMFGINMDEWAITKRLSNVYGNNFHTKLWWEANELNMLANNWEDFLAEVSKAAPIIRVTEDRDPSDIMYELAMFDAHHGAKGWGPETGEHYDLPISVQRNQDAYTYLISQAPEGTGRILFIVGQDLFHFDTLIQGKGGATAKGTPQDVDTRWQKLFVAVSRMLVTMIQDAANRHGRVDVIVQPGNHDTQTTFYCGEFLDAWFQSDDRVRVDNTPKPRKYVKHGEVTLGFTHGDREKAKDLYGLMTEEVGEVTRWREWHRGHLHQEECSEDGTMRIRTIPALSGKESWHNEQGYRGLPGARGFVWHRRDGLLRQEYFNVPFEETHTHNLGVVLEG